MSRGNDGFVSGARGHSLAALAVSVVVLLLSGLHWVKSPYRLSLWVEASDTSTLVIESHCSGGGSPALRHRQTIAAGYFEYQLPLARCVVDLLRVSAEPDTRASMHVSAAAITWYGKVIAPLFGSPRARPGEGAYANETRPPRSDPRSLAQPLVLEGLSLDLSTDRISWPRWLPVLMLPLLIFLVWRRPAGGPHVDERVRELTYPLLLAAVLALVAAAAVTARTDVSVNPDELSHAASARYYYDHWLKPKIGDPETLEAHNSNRYGVAYLTSIDPVYLLAGKFAVLTWPVFQNDVIAMRMFNVTLLLVLLLFALRDPMAQLAAIPLLGTPQAWYVFSYFNSDALALFLATLAVTIILRPKPGERDAGARSRSWRHALVAGILVGMVLLAKINYWTVLGFIGLCIIAREHYLRPRGFGLLTLGYLVSLVGVFYALDRPGNQIEWVGFLPAAFGAIIVAVLSATVVRDVFVRLRVEASALRNTLVAFVAASSVILPFAVQDWAMNGPPLSSAKADALRAVMDATADEGYRPSATETTGAKRFWKMHEKGVPLKEVMVDDGWIATSGSSFLGVYGYMNINAPRAVSAAVGAAFLALSVVIVLVASRCAARANVHGVALALLAGCSTIVAASLGWSWFHDLQPQGRYLLPVLPMLGGALVLGGVDAFRSDALRIACIAAFSAAAISFLTTCLPLTPKLPGAY